LLASFSFSCASSLSSTFNRQYPNSCFRSGINGSSGRAVGPEAVFVVSEDESGGRIGPGAACANNEFGLAIQPAANNTPAVRNLGPRALIIVPVCIFPRARHNLQLEYLSDIAAGELTNSDAENCRRDVMLVEKGSWTSTTIGKKRCHPE
jgi:hypothetical protein